MENAGYVILSRQSGLMRELQAVANNVANASTTGFRREGVVFAEHVARLDGAPSLSMAFAGARVTDLSQAGLTATGGTFDLAIEGEGFFPLATPEGERLTRAGAFLPGPDGTLQTPEGHALLDAGGAPVAVPPDAGPISIAADGTISTPLGPIAQLGLVLPADPNAMTRAAGTAFAAPGGTVPAEGRIVQGHLEGSNVDPVLEIARLIEVQRAYELGQGFLDREDGRAAKMIETLGR